MFQLLGRYKFMLRGVIKIDLESVTRMTFTQNLSENRLQSVTKQEIDNFLVKETS